jgi:hypothetical protein
MPAEDISKSLEDSSFNIIVRQIIATRRVPNGQTHMETLPLFLVTIKYQRDIQSEQN